MTRAFELFIFSTEPGFIARAVESGVDGIIVDWERQGKQARQADADTQINQDTPDDLDKVRRATTARVLCRVNGFGRETPNEIDTAIGLGADEIFLPMVRSRSQVEEALGIINGRVPLSILVETEDAVKHTAELAKLPLSRVYIGLNDLAIDRGETNIFSAIRDGTVERVVRDVRAAGLPAGFAGLTLPDKGDPIPCRLLIGEMIRLGCGFSFLRRSFYRDTAALSLPESISAIRKGIEEAAKRPAALVEDDHRSLMVSISDGVKP